MQILCKIKDFYDYACIYQQERDPFPTFDRKDYASLNNNLLTSWIVDLKRSPDIFEKGRLEDEYFCLEVGTVKYVFKANNFVRNRLDVHSEQYIYDCKISLIREIESLPKVHNVALAISRVDLNYKEIRSLRINHIRNLDIEFCPLEILNFRSRHGWREYNKDYDTIETPILKDTHLPGLLDPLKIYVNIDNYLRSLHNDVTHESKGITDEEKAINKGFNKKESFRNIHPRT